MFSVGMWIWNLPPQSFNYPKQFYTEMWDLGIRHIVVKIFDGVTPYNTDHLKPQLDVARSLGLHLWVWGYDYDSVFSRVDLEGQVLGRRGTALEADGIVIDAEKEWDLSHRVDADLFVRAVRKEFSKPIYLSSYSFPSLHPEFPWDEFITNVDGVMPQVYQDQPTVATEVERSLAEFSRRTSIPTGLADSIIGSEVDLREFLKYCQSKDRPCNLWVWEHCSTAMKQIIKSFTSEEGRV